MLKQLNVDHSNPTICSCSDYVNQYWLHVEKLYCSGLNAAFFNIFVEKQKDCGKMGEGVV